MNRQITLVLAMVAGILCVAVAAILVMSANPSQPGSVAPAGQPSGPQPMAVDLGHEEEPQQIAWSTSGDWLAIVAGDDGDRSLWVSKRSGTAMTEGMRVVLPGGVPATRIQDVVWHPQGLVAFTASLAGGADRIWFYTPGGSTAVELVDPVKVPGALRWPAISADGARVAFVREHDGQRTLEEWSQRTTEVTPRIALATELADAPSYSALGDAIDYTVCDPNCALYEVGADGTSKALGVAAVRAYSRVEGRVWYSRNGDGYDVVTNVGGPERVVGTRAVLPRSGSVAVSGGSVAWTDGAKLHVTSLADGSTAEVPTGCDSIRDVAISSGSEGTTVAWVGLSSGRWAVQAMDRP